MWGRRTFVACALACAPIPGLAQGRRRPGPTPTSALLIGLPYRSAPPFPALSAPPADVELVGAALRAVGVRVTLTSDLANAGAFHAAIDAFAEGLRADEAALFYFAGHGLQSAGRNYLLADDGRELIAVDDIVDALRARAANVIVVLDACRDNPAAAGRLLANAPRVLSREGTSRPAELSQRAGLAQMDTEGAGVMFVFSTDPNRAAVDRLTAGERNSPFALAFARHVGARRSLDESMAAAAAEVAARTRGRQNPWRQNGLTRTIFLAGAPDDWLRADSAAGDLMPPP